MTKSKSKWPKWPWRSRSMTSIFNTGREYPRIHVRCKFGDFRPNLWRVITRTSQISQKFKSKWPKWLRKHGQWSTFSIPAESIPRCMFGANLVILDQICDDLSFGQGKVYGRKDGRRDVQTQATTIPLRPERSGVKSNIGLKLWSWGGTAPADQFQVRRVHRY